MLKCSPSGARTEEGGLPIWVLEGSLDRYTVPDVQDTLLKGVTRKAGPGLALDLGGLTRIDSAGVAFVGRLVRIARAQGTSVRAVAVSDAAREAFDVFRLPAEPADDGGGKESLLVRVGDTAANAYDGGVRFLSLAADTFMWSLGGARRTARVRRGAAWVEAVRIGVDALPIVGLIAFLVGVVVALQAAAQLRQFGGNIYIANLIAVSMTREMGPLMTAIIIAGRSGAAIAAEVATMKVSEEVDALNVMGLEPIRYIIVPKFKAITLTMPALTIYANLLGILAGFVVALLYMGLSASIYFNQAFGALVLMDLFTGMVKAVSFAWIIVLVAAHKGFQAYGGAESVGRVTTSSVVASIFWVIVADAFFSLIFYFGG